MRVVIDADCQNANMPRMQLSQVANLLLGWVCSQESLFRLLFLCRQRQVLRMISAVETVVVSNRMLFLCRQRQVVQMTYRFEAESALLGAVLDDSMISKYLWTLDFNLIRIDSVKL